MAKTKYADGGMTQQPTYPFYGNQPTAATTNPGANQTFNIDNSLQPMQQPNMQRPQGMKKGGAVKASKMGTVKQGKPHMGSASSRGDGIAQRGKTKGRMV